MHLYWRIQLELNEMGEYLIFHDPYFIRAFEKWVKKNAIGLALAEDLTWEDLSRMSMTPN